MCSIWRLAAISDFEGQVANLWIPVVWCFGGKPQEQQQQQEHENGGRPLAIYSELTEWCASRQRAGFARSSRLQAMSSCVRLRNPDCSAGRNLSIRIINHEKRGSDGLGGLEGAKEAIPANLSADLSGRLVEFQAKGSLRLLLSA